MSDCDKTGLSAPVQVGLSLCIYGLMLVFADTHDYTCLSVSVHVVCRHMLVCDTDNGTCRSVLLLFRA